MFKKILSTTVLSVSVLAAMTASATTPGVYVTGQLGYANTHMAGKTNIADINSALPQNDQFVPSNPNDTSLENNGLAGRVAIGYQFNQNFALEAGYLHMGLKEIRGSFSINPGHSHDTLQIKQNALDLVGKSIIPLASNINLYGKLGVAYLTTDLEGKIVNPGLPDTEIHFNKFVGIAKHTFAPEVALGASYDITPNVSVDTSWTHIQPLGSKRPGNIDFVAVGLAYNFG